MNGKVNNVNFIFKIHVSMYWIKILIIFNLWCEVVSERTNFSNFELKFERNIT